MDSTVPVAQGFMPAEEQASGASGAVSIGALAADLPRVGRAVEALTTLVTERERQIPQPALVAAGSNSGEVPIARFQKYSPPIFTRVDPSEDPQRFLDEIWRRC